MRKQDQQFGATPYEIESKYTFKDLHEFIQRVQVDAVGYAWPVADTTKCIQVYNNKDQVNIILDYPKHEKTTANIVFDSSDNTVSVYPVVKGVCHYDFAFPDESNLFFPEETMVRDFPWDRLINGHNIHQMLDEILGDKRSES